MNSRLTHIDNEGKARMVDVSNKCPSKRKAIAYGLVALSQDAFNAIIDKKVPKGDVFATARIAGIMAAKRVGSLIPLCHPLPVEHVEIDFRPRADIPGIEIIATASITAKTGVEMEAMTAVSVSSLTIYDMCKAIDKGISLREIKLLEKSGGKSGHWIRKED